jgi:hypothetical protein
MWWIPHVSASTAGISCGRLRVWSITTCTKDYGLVMIWGGDAYHTGRGAPFWPISPLIELFALSWARSVGMSRHIAKKQPLDVRPITSKGPGFKANSEQVLLLTRANRVLRSQPRLARSGRQAEKRKRRRAASKWKEGRRWRTCRFQLKSRHVRGTWAEPRHWAARRAQIDVPAGFARWEAQYWPIWSWPPAPFRCRGRRRFLPKARTLAVCT